MAFHQTPPLLADAYENDRLLRAYLERVMPGDARALATPSLAEMGALTVDLYARRVAEYAIEPRLIPWDAWGNRIDRIEISPHWEAAKRVATEKGVVAAAYEKPLGRFARTHQFALAYLFDQGTAVYTCPLAMTDGAARTLLETGNKALIERAVPRLTSRDPALAWTSGQWMTERTGGSDVAISETVARADGDRYRLFGTKWFTSATTAEMALTLARPEGNPPGGKGLALFYVETRDAAGRLNGILINRLKDKLGTRQVPTAELTLDGALATPVTGLGDGIKNITPMLLVTRTWNSVAAVSILRRGLALARDYAKKRVAFGEPLADKALHADTLAQVHAEYEAAFLLTFRFVELVGKLEARECSEAEAELCRVLSPVVKLTTGKQAIAGASELVEAFGGAGYVEDTGLPSLLRDAQVLPIWEGTTNVLSLDLLRALSKGASLEVVRAEVERALASAHATFAPEVELTRAALKSAGTWLARAKDAGPRALEGGARRFGLTVGRTLELALLVEHASWALAKGDERSRAAVRVFARAPVDLIREADLDEESKRLVRYDE